MMKFARVSQAVVAAYRAASFKLKGFAKRAFVAQAAMEYCQGKARRAESVFGWNRRMIQTGCDELHSSHQKYVEEERRGRPRSEQKLPEIIAATRKIIDERSQIDPTFRSSLVYTRMTGNALRRALANDLQIAYSGLPSTRTLRRVMNRIGYPHLKTLMIDLDNGPEVSSHRTQFMSRLVNMADKYGLQIELVYYPPYHSKYNRIERCWGALELHWNGTLLKTIDPRSSRGRQWAASMTWHGVEPIVWMLEGAYERGVKWTKKAFASIASRLERRLGLEPWSVTIEPRASN